MLKIIVTAVLLLVLLSGCGLAPEIAASPTISTEQPTLTSTPTITSTPTAEPTVTAPPTLTPTATIIPTATWPVAGPGEVVAPILMYHHVDPDEPASNRYNVTPEVFAAQMQALDEWGYTTITASQLVEAISNGAPLPPRPIVITFDDGHYSTYKYALPIMQEHGFVGVTYIVANRLKSYGFTGPTQLNEMIAAGWEVGSHSYTHADLTVDRNRAFTEIFSSRITLNESLTEEVLTFAYPYGVIDPYIISRTSKWGYTAAMGLGTGYTHSPNTLYYLERIEVQNGYDLDQFASLLPWSAPPE